MPTRSMRPVQPLDNDAESPDELVRRNFAFVDLCGFTQLTDEDGVDHAVAAL